MNKRSLIALSVAFLAIAGTTSNAFAQKKTRAEVRQELIQAENNSLHFVTDTSYPGINRFSRTMVESSGEFPRKRRSTSS